MLPDRSNGIREARAVTYRERLSGLTQFPQRASLGSLETAESTRSRNVLQRAERVPDQVLDRSHTIDAKDGDCPSGRRSTLGEQCGRRIPSDTETPSRFNDFPPQHASRSEPAYVCVCRRVSRTPYTVSTQFEVRLVSGSAPLLSLMVDLCPRRLYFAALPRC